MSEQEIKFDSWDLTEYPEQCKGYRSFGEWSDYENTEFISSENHARTMQSLRKLQRYQAKAGLNKIWIYSANPAFYDDKDSEAVTIRELKTGHKEERIYNFMFDYALINLTSDDVLWIEYYIMKYRFNKIDDERTEIPWNTRAMIGLARIGMYTDKLKRPYIKAIWS